MAHTPTPFKAVSVPEIGAYHVLDKYDSVVAEVVTQEDAGFIVHACNTHYAHVGAVTKALALLKAHHLGDTAEAVVLRALVNVESVPE